MPYDPFNTSSGLIDQYEGQVVESWFGVNPDYNDALTLLFWRIQLSEPEEFPQIEDGVIQEQFTIGPVWESLDGGETVEYPGNDQKNFATNSQYGKIIRRAVDEWGLRSVLEERGEPKQASIWLGLVFEFKAEAQNRFQNRQTGEWVEPRPKVYPVRYLGEGETTEAHVDPQVLIDLPMEQLMELREIARGTTSNGEFLDQAMKLTWVAENGTLIAALADARLWQALNQN